MLRLLDLLTSPLYVSGIRTNWDYKHFHAVIQFKLGVILLFWPQLLLFLYFYSYPYHRIFS